MAIQIIDHKLATDLGEGVETLSAVLNKLEFLNRLSKTLETATKFGVEAEAMYNKMLEAEKEYAELNEKIDEKKKKAEEAIVNMRKVAQEDVEKYKNVQLNQFALVEKQYGDTMKKLQEEVSILNSILEQKRADKEKMDREMEASIVDNRAKQDSSLKEFQDKMNALVTEYEKKKGKQEAKLADLQRQEQEMEQKLQFLKKEIEAIKAKLG